MREVKYEKDNHWDLGIDMYTLPYLKQITNKDLLYSTGNSAQYSVITYIRKEFEKKDNMYK